MEFRQLKTFVTIAKLGSFVQAADTLGYAQSTITNHIQTLENEMRVKLFERLGHRVMLTNQGKSFLPYADQVIKLTSEALEIVANPDISRGKLTIGTSESLGTYRLPGLLQTYRRTYPNVEMILKFANCSTICDCIRSNEIDVGLIINDKIAGDDLVVEKISDEQMLFLVASDHPLSRRKEVTPDDLKETCVILTEPGCSYRLTVETILKEFRVSPQSVLEASSIESIKQLIMLGLGISMLPRFAVQKELYEGQLCAVKWSGPIPGYRVQMLYHRDKWLSPTLQAFLDLTREVLLAPRTDVNKS
ncbi:MAG: Transcriptional regulator, LysR family [Firmicutes bacterium]|nr:Transcriptional regulator, LysR family [Bacillota bacterium]